VFTKATRESYAKPLESHTHSYTRFAWDPFHGMFPLPARITNGFLPLNQTIIYALYHLPMHTCSVHLPLCDGNQLQCAQLPPPLGGVNGGLALKRRFTIFMEPNGSLTCLQESATKLYPRPNTFSPHPSNLKSLLILYSCSSPRIWRSLFPSGFPNNTLYTFIDSICVLRAPPTHSPSLDRSSDSWLRIQITKFLIIPLSSA
jgi:hypothetical protein